ncbi:VOC family protein [Microbacteriaceae bacterium VKM Ac-2854]|nr:VOC family protein [Microbacteriaceae bacterium VKM Ac-2854]
MSGITEIGAVFVPVSDQDRSLAFYVDVLGFAKVAEFEYGGGHHWIEVAPPGAANTIALVPATEGAATPSDRAVCAFATDDIAALHGRLLAAGASVDPTVAGAGSQREGLVARDVTVSDPVPAQFFVRDPDGNRFLVVQPG